MATPPKSPSATPWRNRIVGYGEEDAEQLLANPMNWRVHPKAQQAALEGSLDRLGWIQHVTVNRLTGFVLDGHARAALAISRGEKVPTAYVELTPEEEKLAIATLDSITGMAGTDQEKLDALVKDIRLSDIGIDLPDGLIELLDDLSPEPPVEGQTDADVAPAPPEAPVTVAGDLWVLGDGPDAHRLMCGDATKLEDVQRVMDGESAAMAFTDPPYNIDYEGRTKDKLKIQNDNLGSKFYDFLRDASANILAVTTGAVYICMSSSELHTLHQAFIEAGGHWSTFIIWVKNHFTLGWGDYRRQYEPLLYGWRAGGTHYWSGDRDQGDAWMIDRPAASREHPTMKPVELVERAIRNNSKAGDAVLDTFAGSGTTIIACERTRRRARVIELDPVYCDVAIVRWQNYTGKLAALGDGPYKGATLDQARFGRRLAAQDAIKDEALNAA